ncbi:MAG: VOC family protein [Chloroflexota bacterium]
MSLNLYMVGIMVEDMAKSVQFYRRLGVELPDGSENQQHVEVKMNDLTFFLHSNRLNQMWDPNKSPAVGGYRIVLEFYLENPEGVDAKYQELVDYGYESHFAPYHTPLNTYFAMINDPDGNTILLSAGEPAVQSGGK